MKPYLKVMLSGWLLHTAFLSLYADTLGKEKYLKSVDANWVTPSITVPLAIIVVIAALELMQQARRGDKS